MVGSHKKRTTTAAVFLVLALSIGAIAESHRWLTSTRSADGSTVITFTETHAVGEPMDIGFFDSNGVTERKVLSGYCAFGTTMSDNGYLLIFGQPKGSEGRSVQLYDSYGWPRCQVHVGASDLCTIAIDKLANRWAMTDVDSTRPDREMAEHLRLFDREGKLQGESDFPEGDRVTSLTFPRSGAALVATTHDIIRVYSPDDLRLICEVRGLDPGVVRGVDVDPLLSQMLLLDRYRTGQVTGVFRATLLDLKRSEMISRDILPEKFEPLPAQAVTYNVNNFTVRSATETKVIGVDGGHNVIRISKEDFPPLEWPVKKRGVATEGFALAAKLSRDTVRVGEQVAIDLALKNLSAQERTLYQSLPQFEYALWIEGTGGLRGIVDKTDSPRWWNVMKVLKQNDVMSDRFIVSELYEFRKPGEYRITAARRVPGLNGHYFPYVVSNTVVLRVK